MIIRILGEGLFDLSEDERTKLEELDQKLVTAMESNNPTDFETALEALLNMVRQAGKPVPPDEFKTSEFVLPNEDATLEEIKAMLAEEELPQGNLTPSEESS